MKMSWLPIAPNFGRDLRAAMESPDGAARIERLAALARHRLDFVETIQLDRALGATPASVSPGFERLRLAILGSSTIDHLGPSIRVAGLRRRLLIDAHMGRYGQYRQELLDPSCELHRFKPQIVLFSLTAQSLIADLSVAASEHSVDEALARAMAELRSLWGKARENFNATIVQQTFLNLTDPLFGSYDRLVPAAPATLIRRLNEQLTAAAASEGVLILDIASACERDGLDAWFDVTRWLQGKFEIAPQAGPAYGELAARIIAAQRGLSKKCLVLDLDNTLWGGVIGDDGLEGIVLGEGSAVGEAHLALQRYAKHLTERGIVLAICSKNDPAIAEAAFCDHPEMLLRRSDIAAFVVNWDDKAENLKAVARKLNLGLDSLVFVDDNPVERARIRQSLPMVAVPELPDDVAHYVRCIAEAGYFEAVGFTEEDRTRAGQYTANSDREALLDASQSMDDFLRGLDMSLVFGPVTPVDLIRVTQLINKTNQFNPTTRRYSAEEVASFAASPDTVSFQFRLLDRFGDNGLVSAMILRPLGDQPDTLDIDTWVMSCRVFGRQLEDEAMNIAVETARRRGVVAFRADYIPTGKNGINAELYPALGFVPVEENLPTAGAKRWLLNLADYAGRKTHIARADAAK